MKLNKRDIGDKMENELLKGSVKIHKKYFGELRKVIDQIEGSNKEELVLDFPQGLISSVFVKTMKGDSFRFRSE